MWWYYSYELRETTYHNIMKIQFYYSRCICRENYIEYLMQICSNFSVARTITVGTRYNEPLMVPLLWKKESPGKMIKYFQTLSNNDETFLNILLWLSNKYVFFFFFYVDRRFKLNPETLINNMVLTVNHIKKQPLKELVQWFNLMIIATATTHTMLGNHSAFILIKWKLWTASSWIIWVL